MQNFNLDHNPLSSEAEGLEDCLRSGSTVKTTAYVLDNLLLLGNGGSVELFMLMQIP